MSGLLVVAVWGALSAGFFAGWVVRVLLEPSSLRQMRRDRDDLEDQLDRVYEEYIALAAREGRQRQAAYQARSN